MDTPGSCCSRCQALNCFLKIDYAHTQPIEFRPYSCPLSLPRASHSQRAQAHDKEEHDEVGR